MLPQTPFLWRAKIHNYGRDSTTRMALRSSGNSMAAARTSPATAANQKPATPSGGIDHHHANGGQLGDQDREGVGKQPTGSGKEHGARLSHAGRSRPPGQIRSTLIWLKRPPGMPDENPGLRRESKK